MPEPKPFERLPESVKPKSYNITLQPNLVKCVFHGSEEIELEVSHFFYYVYIFSPFCHLFNS